jgi:hypothetical protein
MPMTADLPDKCGYFMFLWEMTDVLMATAIDDWSIRSITVSESYFMSKIQVKVAGVGFEFSR